MNPFVREFNKDFPNGHYDWPCIIVASEPNYIETKHSRFPTEVTELAIKRLKEQNPHKGNVGSMTYTPTIQRHYFVPNECKLPRTLILK